MKKKLLVILSILTFSLMLISCNKEISKPNTEADLSQDDNIKQNDNIKTNFEEAKDIQSTDTDNTDVVKKENKSVRLYFYDVVNDNIVYYDDTIEVTDKAVTNALVNALKNPTKPDVTPAIAKNISVTSAKLDKENNIFTMDFKDNFVSEMNLGSGSESNTLKAIVNTIGYNFKVDNVIITLGGKPYSSGHISMNDGESFKVSLENVIKLD
ncbi:GerMN domain-containing protein [Clostridium gasigenes]|uniref:GerMN domain-containing protein n=1 Tax=Clostridium gasigenes TaxID=94869 RepID=UPI001C0DC4CE|nr:GerMN domain-containing protein [Clostridium gasigenes]MBU3106806.1 GerMN domain-containing protein [Clostridium gasigenes]